MNPLRENIEYGLTLAYLTLLRICPNRLIYGVCGGTASLFYRLGRRRREITLKNLRIAFPQKSEEEICGMAKAAYAHFGRALAESAMILAGKIDRNDLLKMVEGNDVEKLIQLEQETEKGILFITGHLGNFELLAHYTGLFMKRGGYVVARRGANRKIDDEIVTPMRRKFGNGVIYKSRALPNIARALRRGKHIGLLVDIKTNIGQGVPVSFFGKETLALKSSAFLQLKLDVPVVPVALVAAGPKKYKLLISDPVEWADNGKPEEEQIVGLTQLHQNALEQLIRQAPEQWLWMHDRWKR